MQEAPSASGAFRDLITIVGHPVCAGVPAMQVKAHYEGVAEGLMVMQASPAGGGLAAGALAALQTASTDGTSFDNLQQRHALCAGFMLLGMHVFEGVRTCMCTFSRNIIYAYLPSAVRVELY